MVPKGSGTMLKKLSALTVATIIIIASSMSVFAGNTTGIGDAYTRSLTGSSLTSPSSVTSPSALSKNSNITGSALSGIELKSNKLPGSSFEAALANALRNSKAENNGEFILKITSPDKNKDSTYRKTYVLSGVALHDYDDLVISIARYNEQAEQYEIMYNTDGESSWACYGVFSKEIDLSKGANKIKILTYRKSQTDDPKFQINCFTIELLNESIASKVVRKTNEVVTSVGEEVNKISDGVKNMIDLLSGGKTK